MKNNMKKIAKLMTVLAIAAFTFTSCEDVPSPFGTVTPPTTDADDGNTELPYNSVNLNSGWALKAITADQPWSQGSSYVQATGYQKWDGGETKTNRATKGWLISPAFSTKGYENVKIFFDHTIKYATYTGWEANHKVFVTSNYDETNFSATTWVEVTDFKPVASPYTDWTLYSSGELQLPASMVGQEAIHIGFYFEAPADKSTTWELKNFNIEEGIADNSGGGDDPTPTGEYGTKDNPLTVTQALAVINGLADNGTASPAYVKGKISKVQSYNEQYKSITYYISDDGTDANALQIYSGKGIDGADFAAATDLEKGWTVVVTGELKKYVNKNTGAVTPEINQSSKIVSIDKTTGGGGGEVTPDQPKGNGTEGNPFNVAAAVAKCVETGETATTESYYIKGITDEDYTIGSYKNLEVNIVDKEGCAQKFKVFRVKDKDGKDLKNGWKIAKGSTIIVYGPVVNYKGNTPETATGAYLVSVNGEAPQLDDGTSGGGSGGGDTGSADITAAFGDLDCSDITSIKLSDGTTLSLAQEDGSNAPVYHASTKALRIYARNSLTINAGSKKINKVELAYDTYNGTAYKGNDEMYGEAGSDKLTPTKDDKNVTFNGVNNSTLKVVNWREAGTTGGTQLRLTGISITYVK